MRLDPNGKLKSDEQDSIVLIYALTSPKTVIEVPTKNYVDKKINDPSITKNNAHVDSEDKSLDNDRLIKVNSMPAIREHLTPKYYVDQLIFYTMDEISLLRLDPNGE